MEVGMPQVMKARGDFFCTGSLWETSLLFAYWLVFTTATLREPYGLAEPGIAGVKRCFSLATPTC
jgi:hypothetical protein